MPAQNLPQNILFSNEQTRAATYTTRIAVVCAGLVILSAGILGYTALYDLFVSIGLFSSWLAIFFPLLFDLAEVAAAVSVFNGKLQDEDDKFAWGMVLLFTILGIIANIAHAAYAYHIGKIDTGQVILAVIFTSLFPLSVALVTHLLKRVIGRNIARRELVSTLAELTGQIAEQKEEARQLTADLERTTQRIEVAKAELGKLQGEIEAGKNEQKAVTIQEMNSARQAKIEVRRQDVLHLLQEGFKREEIAQRLGVSVRTVRNDITALNGKVEVS